MNKIILGLLLILSVTNAGTNIDSTFTSLATTPTNNTPMKLTATAVIAPAAIKPVKSATPTATSPATATTTTAPSVATSTKTTAGVCMTFTNSKFCTPADD